MTEPAAGGRMDGLALWAERVPLPDSVRSLGIWLLCKRTARRLAQQGGREESLFAAAMRDLPIASHADEANAQHYELPAEFFAFVLGPRRKYSCCYYPDRKTSLAGAEDSALALTAARAQIQGGQHILELGCGWGSLSLYLAERFPSSQIIAVSNSASQRAHILRQAHARRLGNLEVVTADMNDFETDRKFDRIVSVEMFEHISNWDRLLGRARSWVKPEGRLFLHIFTHVSTSYRFDHENDADWIGQHFFTGGLMPSEKLLWRFSDHFEVEDQWRWSGHHYARTARDWLANFDRNRSTIRTILADVYGPDARLWERRWRLFFLATAGLFGHRKGEVWGVSHYRLKPAGVDGWRPGIGNDKSEE